MSADCFFRLEVIHRHSDLLASERLPGSQPSHLSTNCFNCLRTASANYSATDISITITMEKKNSVHATRSDDQPTLMATLTSFETITSSDINYRCHSQPTVVNLLLNTADHVLTTRTEIN
jgi:hypothetical protein